MADPAATVLFDVAGTLIDSNSADAERTKPAADIVQVALEKAGWSRLVRCLSVTQSGISGPASRRACAA